MLAVAGVSLWWGLAPELGAQEIGENEEAELAALEREEMESLLRDLETDILMEQYRELSMDAFRLEKELRLTRVELETVQEKESREALEGELRQFEGKLEMIREWTARVRDKLLESVR
jgi:hypothetical protein